MSSLAVKSEPVPVAKRLWFSGDFICLELTDGRQVMTPLEFYPRLQSAKTKERNKFRLIGQGTGIHWPTIDEDLSVQGIVLGRPSAYKP